MKLTRKQQEDLYNMVEHEFEQNGWVNWSLINSYFPEAPRISYEQQYLRFWYKKERFRDDYHSWTSLDVELLAEFVRTYGRDWSKICEKTWFWMNPTEIKNKFFELLKEGKIAECEEKLDKELAETPKDDRDAILNQLIMQFTEVG